VCYAIHIFIGQIERRQLSLLLAVDTTTKPLTPADRDAYLYDLQTPLLFEAINYNGLPSFLVVRLGRIIVLEHE
jgi:hypothetical protein